MIIFIPHYKNGQKYNNIKILSNNNKTNLLSLQFSMFYINKILIKMPKTCKI